MDILCGLSILLDNERQRGEVCFLEERKCGGSFSVFLGLSLVQSSVQFDPTRAINKGE
jgi:hypothetical protein